jgi:hypothetical protein
MEDAISITSAPALIAYTNDKEGEDTVYLNPDEYLMYLVDAKRTSPPIGCSQTYLTDIYDGGATISIFDAKHLKAFVGCPVAILSDLDGKVVDYAIIKEINQNQLILSNELKNKYYAGAFVHNLSNRWWKYPLKKEFIGIKAGACRPSSLQFYARFDGNEIEIMISDILNRGTMVSCDVYVRLESFSFIEPHWMPDAADLSLDTTNIKLATYGGGIKCGGGKLSDKEYCVGIVSKDKIGRVDVNESIPFIQVVKVGCA